MEEVCQNSETLTDGFAQKKAGKKDRLLRMKGQKTLKQIISEEAKTNDLFKTAPLQVVKQKKPQSSVQIIRGKKKSRMMNMLIKEAKLTHDTEFFKKMDPYVDISYLN